MAWKCYPTDKFNKSTRRICLIYFSMAPFNDNIKFPFWNLNINNLMFINFHISLITKRFFRSFDHHIDKTVAPCELLQDIRGCYTLRLSGRTGSALVWHSEGRTFAAESVQQVLWFAVRIAVCNTWSSGGTALCRVAGATSELDLPSLTPLSVAGCGWLQLEAPHWATSVNYCK